MIFLNKNKNEWTKIPKSQRTTKILAIILISIILISDFSKHVKGSGLEVNLTATPATADVGEFIKFNWTNSENYDSGQINFGDGNVTVITNSSTEIIHKYTMEGTYNVTLYLKKGISDNIDSVVVHIKNDPPQFNISLPSQAYEDEVVNISVIDLVESDHDLQEGILQFIYDFADGNQTTSNKSSILHSWKNTGDYLMTVTVIDDQGALDQKVQLIEIENVDPSAMFTIDADIPPEQLRSSYYATYDFRQDIIGSEPTHWEVHDSSSVGVEKTAIIRPNEDVRAMWSPYGTHYWRLDESTPDGTTIYATCTGRRDEFGFTTFPDDIQVKHLKFYIYGKLTGQFATFFSWRIGGGSYSTNQKLSFGYSYSWDTVEWSCDLTKAQLDNLIGKFESMHAGDWEPGQINIDTLYCEISYLPNTSVSIVDVGGDFKEVVQLYDEDSEQQIWMENNFAEQQLGTLEFYVKSTNTNSITWAFSLWDSSTSLLAFQVLMANNTWKYATGTSETISELGTPLNNTWYWVRIDFCVSGAYSNLTSLQFRITVNDTASNVYTFSTVNKVNKIRFESAIQDKGIAWIDAIGYSFDPHYKCGDNKIPLISYPEKSNVLFSAANCTDTESDLASLRFYWQFGDNSSGFGKYVSHNYLSSGRYVVNLTCKDDNGALDSHYEIVLIHNAYPSLNLTTSTENITIYEGETVTFTTETLDDSTDMARLSYWWQFNGSGINPYNLSNCMPSGWKHSNLFMDDFNDTIYLLVKDPEGAFDYDSLLVTVLNMDPLISIWDASIIANISFEVYRNSPSYNANFTFRLIGDDDLLLETLLNFTGSEDTIVYSSKELIAMTLSRNWRVEINTLDQLPVGSWFRCYIRLQFLSGEELVICSNKLYGGSYGYYDSTLNPYFFNNGDFTFMYPITFMAQIWDPSIDDISFNVQYSVEMLLEINCSDSLPISDFFILEYPNNDVNYTVSIYEENGTKCANITATQLITSEIYVNNSFPVNLDLSFTIFPIIDLFEILEVQLNLSEVSILKSVNAFNFLNASVYDDDLGSDKLSILFNTDDGIEFINLSPKLDLFIPDSAEEGYNVTFYVEAWDFDQIIDLGEGYIADFKSEITPVNSNDFTMINGTLDEFGDLRFQDGSYTVFNSDFTISNPNVPSQPNNFTVISGTSDWNGDFYLIDNDYTIFSSEEHVSSSVTQYIDSISYTKASSGSGTIENTYTDDSNYKQIIAVKNNYNREYRIWDYIIKITFNFNPTLNGRDFYLSCDIVTSDGRNGYLKVNGAIKSSGTTIDFDDMLIEDVTSITFETDPRNGASFNSKIYYFKLIPIVNELNFTSTIKVEATNSTYLFYSHLTTIPQSIDMKIWNYGSSQWDTIDSSNYDIFSEQIFTLTNDYYNEGNEILLSYYGVNLVNAFSLRIDMLKIAIGNFTLNFTSTLYMDNIDDVEILKYLKFICAYRTDFSYAVNLSLYNFRSELWELIDSSVVGTSNYKYKYSILSSDFYNETYSLKFKIESNTRKLWIDQLKVEYYSSQISDYGIFEHETIPEMPEDFTISSGSCDWDGNLLTQDNDYLSFTSQANQLKFTSKLRLNGVRPDDDIESIELLWSFKTNISLSIDISIYNYNTSSWTLINTSISLQFSNYSYSILNSSYFGPYYMVKVKFEGGGSSEFDLYLDQLKLHYNWIKNSYHDEILYKYVPRQPYDFSFYNGTLESKGDLFYQDNDYSTFIPDGYGGYPVLLDFESQFILQGLSEGDTINHLSLNYSYRTDMHQLINISIYNFTSTEWQLLDSSVHTSFFSGSDLINHHDYYDSNFIIRIRVEGFNSTSDFQLFFDQLTIEYQYISYFFKSNYWWFFDVVEDDYVIFDSTEEYLATYSFENDFIGAVGTDVSIIDYYIPCPPNPPGGGTAYSKVIAELDGHNTVLKCYDDSTYAGGYVFTATHIFPTNIEYGTVELWVYKKDLEGPGSDAGSPLVFRNSANETLFAFNMDKNEDDLVRFTRNNGDITFSGLYTDDTWYHIRIDFETRENGSYLGLTQYTLNFWFDGVKELDGVGFYENGTLNNLYWHSGGYGDKADYYFDAIAFSWDDEYEVGQNEDPNALLNELFDLELTNMDSIKYELFNCAELSYSFKTNITQQIKLKLYNFSSQRWVEIDANITNNSAFYSSTYWFITKDFISSEYKCKVQIIGYNVNDFELHLQELELKYTWGGVACNLGQYDLLYDLTPNLNMTSEYSTIFQGDFIFEAEGLYLITITADDGYSITKNGTILEIKNLEPYAHIGNYPNQTFEDSKIYLSSEVMVFGTNLTQSDLRYFWAFGDGLYSFEAHPVHAWSEAGIYNITLTIVDCYSNTYTDIQNITVLERAPEIKGPFTFYGVEGQAVTLDVDIFDAFLDELTLEYKWYDSSELISTDKKPSLILQDGTYEYTLNVTDKLGYTATADISVILEDAPPIVITSNFRYSGVSVSGTEGFFVGEVDDPGELELTAYGYDIYSDNNDLDYYWSITNDNTTYDTYDLDSGLSSIAKFRVKETAVYLGQVKIVSANKSAVTSFIINSFIDSNGNGISDEFEAMILEFYEDITAYSDYDEDGLTDLYELHYNISDYQNPDSDDDGLWDGLNPETGIGEQSFSTKPNDPDCDDDELTDGMEFFGWNVTTDVFGTIAITSDPWKNDTDGDGLFDYEEYCYGTNPRTSDTDTDGILDSSDPYPTKYDYDGDGLSDKYELELGTALNVSDTDNDGISDAEEILGWFKTNPLSADSDHDFASDSAEIQNYHVAIDDRYDLDDPISISFEINCERAVSAQIAFMITFGEAINEEGKEYGIQDVPDLNVSIIKVDDNLLLFNATTNSTRYYSKVIDIKEIVESNGKDYRGEYMVQINNTEAGCILEQFEIEITGYLNPNDADFDNDGIMDGVEMGLLVRGTDTIDHSDLYGENTTVSFPMEETCWWTLDEGTGTTAEDLTFYENDGTLTNMESGDWMVGKIGDHALQFDGVDEYIDCGNEYFLDFERNDIFTLSAWVKTTSTGKAILSKMNVSENYRGYDLFIHSTGVLRAHLINELDSNEIIVDGSTAINDNSWHFIVLAYNGSSSASGVKLFVDGSLNDLTIVEDTLNATIYTNVDFLVGARTSGNYFSGQIDDVRVYSFELTQENVAWLYNNGNGRPSKTLNGDDVAEVNTQYYLEIPYVGIVYDANLTLAIESEGIPIGSGNITIEIVKEEINCSISNVILSSAFNEFSDTSQFFYEKFIDITPYVNNNSITEYYGKYLINIKIHGTDYRDKFIITEFYLLTDTYVEAGPTDTEGWITNPGLDDTDGDGWNDYKEIFIEGTNPLSADTDGDGVWDKYDRDPLRDVMLEISPISGAAPGQYKLKIVTIFTTEDTGEKYYIPTPKLEAHIYLYSLWTAYFDGTYGSSTELHYYANINDDVRVQSNTLEFILQLWRVDRYATILGIKVKKWDKKLVGATDTYHINQVGYSEILTATKYDDQVKVYETKVQVKTIGVEKANTIAIYETNGTTFNGHYQEQERMNILQLYVNDSGAGTPFVEGPNIIVIPTSLFTETVFNAYVQNETLSETPIYSTDEDIFMFISVGRDGDTKQACEEIDFIFIRFDISSEDAMEVLTLLLTCLVNETTNETAIVYSYVSTNLNDTTAVMMNLPFSVLGFIPWFCNFTESPMGSKPETFEDWFWKPLKTLGKAIVGVIIFIGMAIVAFIELIVEFVAEILMEWLPILEYIVLLIVRVIILILIWISFAIMLLIVIALFISLIAIGFLLNTFIDLDISISLNKIEVEGDIELSFIYEIDLEYNNFLHFYIPVLRAYFEAFEDFAFEYTSNGFSENFKFIKFPIDLFSNFNNEEPEQSENILPRVSGVSSVSSENISDILIGIGVGMGIAGGIVASISSIKTYLKCKALITKLEIAAFCAFTLTLGIFICTLFLDPSYWSFIGLGVGFLIAGVSFILTAAYINLHRHNFMAWFDNAVGQTSLFKIATKVDTFGAFVGVALDFEGLFGILEDFGENYYKIPMVIFSLGTGVASLACATQFLLKFGGHYEKHPSLSLYKYNADSKIDISLLFGLSSICIGLLFIFIAGTVLWEE